MKQRIVYPEYINRVHGCWLGKCIAGAIAAAYGEQKPPAEIHFEPGMLSLLFPNADFDLQVLWLEVLEHKGIHVAAEDIVSQATEEFPAKYGSSPLGFELWACVAPGDPALAAKLAALGATSDSSDALFQARQFLAALGARAFIEPDLDLCLDSALEFLPRDSLLQRLVRDTRTWCETVPEDETRRRIMNTSLPPDLDNLFRDIALALRAMHYGESDFIQTLLTALAFGGDTLAPCTIAGAILGIHHAATGLMNRYALMDQPFVLGVRAHRGSERICDLAEDVARVGIAFAPRNNAVEILGGPHPPKHP